MRHQMNLYNQPFYRIKEGRKVIEVRLNDTKRQKIAVGDEIEFSLIDDNQTLIVEVIGLSKFVSFKDLYSRFHYSMFGHPHNTTLDEQIEGVREYYSKEKEKEFGALGIHIRLK